MGPISAHLNELKWQSGYQIPDPIFHTRTDCFKPQYLLYFLFFYFFIFLSISTFCQLSPYPSIRIGKRMMHIPWFIRPTYVNWLFKWRIMHVPIFYQSLIRLDVRDNIYFFFFVLIKFLKCKFFIWDKSCFILFDPWYRMFLTCF